MVLLTCTIGILNICLGYTLAVYLGYGPPGILEGWDVLMGNPLTEPPELSLMDWTGGMTVEATPQPGDVQAKP